MERILVHSYKGGTGKTTIALNMANQLASENKVLLIESDFFMPSFHYIFQSKPELYFNDYLKGDVNFNETIIHETNLNIDVIFTNKDFDPNEKIMGSDQKWFIVTLQRMMKDLEALEDHYDFVIFDSPPGWHMILINLIMLCNKAILILRPNSYAVSGTQKMIEIIYKRAKPIRNWDMFILFNQVPEIEMITDLERWGEQFQKNGIKYAGYISCSCETSYQMAHEAMIFSAEHPFHVALKKAINNMFNGLL
ncbi:MAG: tyrosine-protein kinase family protein [Promethearchaeota archaeon]